LIFFFAASSSAETSEVLRRVHHVGVDLLVQTPVFARSGDFAQRLQQTQRSSFVFRKLRVRFQAPVRVRLREPRARVRVGRRAQRQDVRRQKFQQVRHHHAHAGGAVGHAQGQRAVHHLHLRGDLLRGVEAQRLDGVVDVEQAFAAEHGFFLQRFLRLTGRRRGQ
jgi:hypothetical protein